MFFISKDLQCLRSYNLKIDWLFFLNLEQVLALAKTLDIKELDILFDFRGHCSIIKG